MRNVAVNISGNLILLTSPRKLAKTIAREPNPERFKALVNKYRNELSECHNDRIVNELWRDKREHWVYKGIHYRSGKNFRSLAEWWKIPSFKVDGDNYHEWRLVYRRGRVYRSRHYANSFGQQIMLYGNQTGEFLCFCTVTGCAPVEKVDNTFTYK